MKQLNNYINESLKTNTTFYMPSAEVLSLYLFEAEGQISDGKYENEKTNWEKWFDKINFVQGDPGFKSRCKIYPYEFDDIIDIKEIEIRMLTYGRLAKVLEFDFIKELYVVDVYYDIRTFIEFIGNMLNENLSYNEAKIKFDKKIKSYSHMKKNLSEYLHKIFNEELYEKYKKSKYSLSELKSDIKLLDEVFINKK